MDLMSFFSVSGLLNGASCLALGFFVFFKNRKRLVNRTYLLFAISVAVWSFGYYFWPLAKNKIDALNAFRLLHFGAVYVTVFYYHFVCALTDSVKKNRRIIIAGYVIASFIAIFIPTKLYIQDMVPKFIFKFWAVPGILYHFYLMFFFFYVILAVYKLFIEFKLSSDATKRKQYLYILLASIIGYFGGSTNYPLWYNIPIYPVANILVTLYVGTIAYAIVRHQLLDVEVIIKKTLVFASLFTIVFGIFVGITVLLQQFIGGSNNILGFAISSIVIIFTVRPLEIFLVRITDKYLFQKKYDYRHLIRDFMDELKTMVLNADDIAQSTIDFLNSSIRPISSAIFMYNKFTGQYDLIASGDFKDKSFKIPDSSRLIKMLGETGKIMNVRSDDSLLLSEEKDQLSGLGVELIIPLLIHKELIGLLCLGKKKSDEDYAEDDIGALSDLSGALSISLNNAQLFDERADAEKRALVGTIATGINHEVGNPLNIITIKLDTFRILAKEGLLAHKTKEQIIEEVDKITKVCLESAQRIAEITKQVAEFAKPDKKLIFDKVNISEAIDETIAFLKHGMIIEPEKIEKRIACEPAYALVDRGQLKQILFNLVKNASHAIDKEKGKIVISADKNSNGEVIIKVVDNGRGISKAHMDKVFTPFFTTKEPGKGTGLGLALVKIMMDRNGARIKVESEEGRGTTFTLIFKGGLL